MAHSSSPEGPNIEYGELLAMGQALREYTQGKVRRRDGIQSASQRAVMQDSKERARAYGRRLNKARNKS